MSARIPLIQNPIKNAEQEFAVLLDQLEAALRERDEAIDLSRNLVAENDAKSSMIERQAEELQRKDARIVFLQGYATRVTTRLDTIVDVIKAAKEESAREAGSIAANGNGSEAASVNASDAALDIRLPLNRLTTNADVSG